MDYFTGKTYAGRQTINFDCPLERMPIFVKQGIDHSDAAGDGVHDAKAARSAYTGCVYRWIEHVQAL